MFIHLLAGGLVFLFFGQQFGWFGNPWTSQLDPMLILAGGFCGVSADALAMIFYEPQDGHNEVKHHYLHRDNFSHSVFMPVFAFHAVLFAVFVRLIYGYDLDFISAFNEARYWAILVMTATLTHPLCDLFGVGWGVKLFYPLDRTSYKLFYKKKFLTKWTTKELEQIVRKEGRNDWYKAVYFSLDWGDPLFWWGAAVEYPSLAAFLYLFFIHI